jgi:hypothetical protein
MRNASIIMLNAHQTKIEKKSGRNMQQQHQTGDYNHGMFSLHTEYA